MKLSEELRARFGNPIVTEPPIDPYEPNPFLRWRADNAMWHKAENIRRWKKRMGLPNATSQTDSDGENEGY